MDSQMRTELVVDAPLWRWRGMEAQRPLAGLLVHHSDGGGVQYTAISLGANASKRSASRSLDGKDRNRFGQSAMAESFIATLKTELVVH